MTRALVGQWSRLLATTLAQAGLTHAVICPGSRSTPFAWALAEEPAIRCLSVVDERVAGFVALGIARATGEPALVLSTSGSAAANFFPAVVEASLARLPLIVLTADRPLELQGADAAQTIDQVKLYGDHARGFFDLGAPEAAPTALAGLRRMLTQACAQSRGPEPGPVHVNARAKKPLEPGRAETPDDRRVVTAVDRLVERGVTRVELARPSAAEHAVRRLAERLAGARRGLIVCGPRPAHAQGGESPLGVLAARLGMPLFAEATSGERFGGGGRQNADALGWLLRSLACRAALAPDCILRFGAPLTAGGFEALFGEDSAPALHVVAEHGHPDALGRAETLTVAPAWEVATALEATLGAHVPSAEQRAFAASVASANTSVWNAVRGVTEGATALGEPVVARLAVESLPPGGLLVVGNSLPVRLVDDFVPSGTRGLRVASQRGANGIDGLIAGAAGSAMAHAGPTLLLVGDVSVLHDLGGLAAARLVATPFAIVVLDNGGGRIFEQLPVAGLWDERPAHEALWLTPPRLALEHAAALFDLPYVAATDAAELETALGQALTRAGATLVHARVTPHGARDALRGVLAELEQSTAPLLAEPRHA